MEKKPKNDEVLQVLLDKQEIYELLARYCRGVDRCDEPLLRTIFLPDATVDYSVFKGNASDFCDWTLDRLSNYNRLTMHRISNILIEVKGDVAYGETYCCAYQRVIKEDKDSDLLVGLRYLDRFERRNGVWKIANRRLVFDWNRNDPSTEEWGSGYMNSEYLRGCRGPEDPVYHYMD